MPHIIDFAFDRVYYPCVFFQSGPWYDRIAENVLIDCTSYRMVFHLRSGLSYHFENLAGTKVRYREDYCAAAEVLDTILVLVAFCDLAIFDKTLVAVVFGLDTCDRSLSQIFDRTLVVVAFGLGTCNRSLLVIFDNNLAVVGFDSDNGDNNLAVGGL